MKTKRSKKDYSEEESGDPELSWSVAKKSDFVESSEEEVSKKSKKRKKRRVSSSDSDSDDSDRESHKKKKHKKKKRKHSKKKRKDVSSDDSESDSDEVSSEASEEESPVVKKKHKHRHKHSSKHSKKRRHSESETYPDKDSESSVEPPQTKPQKIKSFCAGKTEQILSSEEEAASKRRNERRDYAEGNSSKVNDDHYHSKHRNYHADSKRHYEDEKQYYKDDSRSHGEGMGDRIRDRHQDDRRHYDKPKHPDQYYDYNKQKDDREYHQKQQPVHNRVNLDGQRQNYDKYANNRQNFDKNLNNRYQEIEKRDAGDNRYGGGQTYNRYNDREGDNRQGYNNNKRMQHQNYQQQDNNYQQHDNRQDGGNYHRNKDYQQRNDNRGYQRYQERNDYFNANQTNRRYENREENERDRPVKKERSMSDVRDVKDERGTSQRQDSRDIFPKVDLKREDREVSGASRGRDNRNPRLAREQQSPKEEEDNGKYEWGKKETKEEDKVNSDKDKPNFGLSGKLAEDTNMVDGVVLKYNEPPEARKPKRRWRFYPFKGDKALSILYIHRQSCFLLGRDRKVADIPLDHPSVSKQHAALQYRLVPFTRDDGTTGKRIRPYIIDLGSANGTFVNNKKIDPSKYVELLERDVVKFGFSQREYVLLHENSREEGMDDDVRPGTGTGSEGEGKSKIKEEDHSS